VFNIKLDDPKVLNGCIGVISDFITEANFKISKEGIELIAMDPANISMVVLKLLPSAFTNYEVTEPQNITVNLDNFKQSIKRAKSGDILNLSLDKNKLVIDIRGKSKKKFSIPLLEREGKERKVPTLEFNAIIELDADELKDVVDDASIVGDAITLEASSDLFTIHAGDQGSKVQIDLERGNQALVNMQVREAVQAIYSVEYLKKMTKTSNLSDTATVQFSKDYPLRLDFKSLNKFQMSFILAPRIENK
jgi:proliferating cell nuclear antigen